MIDGASSQQHESSDVDAVAEAADTGGPSTSLADDIRSAMKSSRKGSDSTHDEPTESEGEGERSGPFGASSRDDFEESLHSKDDLNDIKDSQSDKEAFNILKVPGLRQEEKDQIRALGPDAENLVGKILARRETDVQTAFHTKLSQVAELARPYQELAANLSPEILEQWALEGTTPGQKISQYVAFQKYIDQDPVAGINWLASQYGMDLSRVASLLHGQSGAAQREDHSPYLTQQTARVDPTVQHLQSQLHNLLAERDQQRAEALTAARQEVADIFYRMAQATDETGEALYPYLPELATQLEPVAEQLRQQNPTATYEQILTAAYERTAWQIPQVRERLISKMTAKQEKERAKTIKERAIKAKRAGFSPGVSTSSAQLPSGDVDVENLSLREQLLFAKRNL